MDTLNNQPNLQPTSEANIVERPPIGPTVLLESSFLFAILVSSDANHKPAKAVFNFVEPFNCRFHIPLLVFSEVLSRMVRSGKTVSASVKMLEQFTKTLPGSLFSGEVPEDLGTLSERYKNFGRKKIKGLTSNDFLIVTEGILSGSLILTGDYEMFRKVNKYHADIFYITANSPKYDRDISRFTERFLELVKTKQKNGT